MPPINATQTSQKALAFGDIDIGDVKHIYDYRRKRNKENSNSAHSFQSGSDRGTGADIITDDNNNQMQNPFNFQPQQNDEDAGKRLSTANFLESKDDSSDEKSQGDQQLEGSSIDAEEVHTQQQCKCKATVLIVDDNQF